jgi:TetR/AcrR family tetracycline transcriptional repressor
MAKIKKHDVLLAALILLDELGLDELSTRQIALRLGVESPALYWHFKNKAELLTAMSEEVMMRWHTPSIPEETEVWPTWFADNVRSFRATHSCVIGTAHASTQGRGLEVEIGPSSHPKPPIWSGVASH